MRAAYSLPALRMASLLAALAVMSCSSEPTSIDVRAEPTFQVIQSSAGGVTLAAGSGCTVVLSHFECSLSAEGVGSSDQYNVTQRGAWTYTYQCVHKKTDRPSKKAPAVGQVTTTDLRSVTGSNNQIIVSGTVLAPTSPRDCAANKGAFTTTVMLNTFTPLSWSILVSKNEDPENFFASMFEVL